jgi:hypothetical protein
MARWTWVLVGAAFAMAGCSSSAPGTAGVADTAPDAASDAASDASCTVPLARFSYYCPATFDGTLASVSCPSYDHQHVYRCGDSVVLAHLGAFTSTWCVYDAASGSLVGARRTSDSAEYCDGCFGAVAGAPVDLECVAGTPTAARVCPRSAPDAAPDGAADATVSE